MKNLYGNIINRGRSVKRFAKNASLKLTPQEGENDFVDKWKDLYPHVSKKFYRFYSQYIGKDPNIVPDDCFHTLIEPLLNNQSTLLTYSNKNMFERLFPQTPFPPCIIRRVGLDWMDCDYRLMNMNENKFREIVLCNKKLIEQKKMIIKPALGSSGGQGVRLYLLQGDGSWKSNDGRLLTLTDLEKQYKRDFIVQECIEPSDFVKQFNPDSYNTVRIFTYRSVKDDSLHFLGGYLRIGAKGNFKDNMGSGGFSIPFDGGGRLMNYATNIKRQRFSAVNGVSLEGKKYVIPNFESILAMVFDVALKNIPNRLLSFDVILDTNNVPHLIEYNVKWQTVSTIQTTTGSFFGKFTDEVIDYCKKHKDYLSYVSLYTKVT